jgi:glycosyltransferase involved in cell wall biosynthesis
VHLVHSYPPEFRGGTEACVETLATAQLARGDEPLVITGSDIRSESGGASGDVLREEVGLVPVWRVRRREDENYSVDARLPRLGDLVLRLLEEVSPSVVHLHHTLNLTADLASRVSGAGYPVVATLHDFTLVCARFFLSRPDGESCAGHFPLPSRRCFDCVLPDFPGGAEQLEHELRDKTALAPREAAALSTALVPSRLVAERWRRSGLFRDDQLELLPHAPGVRKPSRPHRPGDGRLRLATWGHLAPAKGVHDLLLALRELSGERVSLRIFGAATDEDHERVLRTAAEGLDVQFHGAYDADDIREAAPDIDLAVFPSRAEETFGLVVAEARAFGLPVVTSDRGALPESVGAAGTSVPAAAPAELAALLRALLADPSRLESWRAATAQQLLDPAAHADRVDTVYQRALAAARPATEP